MRHLNMLLVTGGLVLGSLAGALPGTRGADFPSSAKGQVLPYMKTEKILSWRQGEVLMASGQYSQAHQYLRRLLSDDQENPHIWYLLGKIAEHQGDLEGAQAAYRRTLALSPGYPELSRVLMAHSRGDALPIWDPVRKKKTLPSAAPAAQNPILPQDGTTRHAVALGVVAVPMAPPQMIPGNGQPQPLQPMVPPQPVAGTAQPRHIQPIVPPQAVRDTLQPQHAAPVFPSQSAPGVIQPWNGQTSASPTPLSPDQPADITGKP